MTDFLLQLPTPTQRMSKNEFADSSLSALGNPITGLSQFTFRTCFQKEFIKTFPALTKLAKLGRNIFTSLYRVLRGGAWELLINIQTDKRVTAKSRKGICPMRVAITIDKYSG